uniref:EOG090X0DHL n=1 Tax=Eubosmina coregoni TaxID=186181 RepID=A0A4Y7LLN3_9CRUS|nr:EOG090X0DHL [Eubosmina coregoni]SVE70057.1 EOG090X0DHL [Eubosmina coregoni]
MMTKDNRRYYLDLKENPRGRFLRVKTNYRTAVTIPEKSWSRFRDIFSDYVDKMKDGGGGGGVGTLARIFDVLRLSLHFLGEDLDKAILEQLNLKFANKVVQNVGLCIALWDIVERGESFMFPGDSGHHTKVKFRILVFRPFVDQILVGKIKSCDHESVRVTLGFFDDITIPKNNLQKDSEFDSEKQEWIWKYPTDDGPHELFMEKDEDIRFKVVSDMFVDTTPTGNPGLESSDVESFENKKTSYRIIAAINDSGLGPLTWWTASGEEEDNGE